MSTEREAMSLELVTVKMRQIASALDVDHRFIRLCRDWADSIDAHLAREKAEPVAALIVRDLCELEPADIADPNTVAVSVADLQLVIDRHAHPTAPAEAKTDTVLIGVDKGSPAGDCTVRGHREPNGTIAIDSVEYAARTGGPVAPKNRLGEYMLIRHPLFWEEDESRAWNRAIPDVLKAFDSLCEATPPAPTGFAPIRANLITALPRYGLQWNGPKQFVAVPMADGYWTPWHLAMGLPSMPPDPKG